MARKDQYIRSKANYTLRKRHMATEEGTIYEHDHMTIVPDNGLFSDDIRMYSDSNFMFRIRTDGNSKKKYVGGKWVKPDDDEFEFWTEGDCIGSDVTTETKIVLKPNYQSIKDFAYFGSAVELVKAAVKDVVLNYPGGIYYVGEENAVKYDVRSGSSMTTMYSVANDFLIDLHTMGMSMVENVDPMRYLSASYGKYLFGPTGVSLAEPVVTPLSECVGSLMYEVVLNDIDMNEENAIVLYVYKIDYNKTVVVSPIPGVNGNCIIRPNSDVFDTMYDKLDEFSKVLLDRTTNPRFKARFKVPYANENGYYYSMGDFIWPSYPVSDDGYVCPKISGIEFSGYINSLNQVATYYDEHETDNIWRMMTHESIKNMDWTFMREKNGETSDLSDFDSSRIQGVLRLFGRQFDDLKRYTDNIKNTDVITYDQKNNIPDYFLTDSIGNKGWFVEYAGPTNDNTIVTEPLYPDSLVNGSTASDANIGLLRRISLNSEYILSMKGTRRGIETVLGLFGFVSGQTLGGYDMHEYVAVATEFPEAADAELCASYADDYYDDDNHLADYPVNKVTVYHDDDTVSSYIVPWYDHKNENLNYMYHQMKGGWKHVHEKQINTQISVLSSITETEGIQLYGETQPYLRYASNIQEMLRMTNSEIYTNMVCYVYNITDIYDGYSADEEDSIAIADCSGNCYSHYFVLKNIDLSTRLGFVSKEDSDGRYNCYGWRNVLDFEFNGVSGDPTCDGTRVLYLESIVDKTTGNNPHVGYGSYDDGKEFLDYLNQIFKYKIDNNMFTRLRDDDPELNEINLDYVKSVGFKIGYDLLEDNTKTHYFGNVSNVAGGSPEDEDESLVYYEGKSGVDGDVSEDEWSNYEDFYTQLTNPEGFDSKITEETAYSVVNVKNFMLNFTTEGNMFLRKYITDVVLPYIEQMIPSTTIFKYTFDNGEDGGENDFYILGNSDGAIFNLLGNDNNEELNLIGNVKEN